VRQSCRTRRSYRWEQGTGLGLLIDTSYFGGAWVRGGNPRPAIGMTRPRRSPLPAAHSSSRWAQPPLWIDTGARVEPPAATVRDIFRLLDKETRWRRRSSYTSALVALAVVTLQRPRSGTHRVRGKHRRASELYERVRRRFRLSSHDPLPSAPSRLGDRAGSSAPRGPRGSPASETRTRAVDAGSMPRYRCQARTIPPDSHKKNVGC